MFNSLMKSVSDRRSRGEGGFSLIELIVVVVILGILVAIAIPTYGNIQDNSKRRSIEANAQNASSSLVAKLSAGETIDDRDAFLDNLSMPGVDVTYCNDSDYVYNICLEFMTELDGKDMALQARYAPDTDAVQLKWREFVAPM